MGLPATMSMDFYMIADHDPRQVQYFRRGVLDTYAPAVNVTAFREPIAAGTLTAAGAILPQGSVAFYLPGRELPEGSPRPDDRVIDEGRGFTIDSVENQAAATRYRIVCIPEA